MFEPQMKSTTLAMNEMWGATNNVFKAISDQSAFGKLNEDLKAVVTMLRIAKGLLQGFGDILSGAGDLISGTLKGVKTGVKAATIGAYAVAGGDRDIAADAFSELWQQTTSSSLGANSNQPQKIDLNINHVNAPKGTTVEVKKSPTTNLRVGNTVSNGAGGAGE